MVIRNKYRIIALLLIVLVISSILYGCSIGEGKTNIYDNEDKITQEGDSYSFLNRLGKADKEQMDIDYSRFYGVQTIWTIQIDKQGEIKLDYDSQVKSGDFKVVLVTPEKKLINIVEQSNKGTYKSNIPEGKYRVKVVGRNASGRIRIFLETGEGSKVLANDN